ncbi:MAG: hypothetical protein ACKVOP_00120 [Sphingomonadaceae bacterium]
MTKRDAVQPAHPTTPAAHAASAPPPLFSDPVPLDPKRSGWLRWVGPAMALAILVVVVLQLRQLELSEIIDVIPTNLLFWVVFALYYVSGPAFDWIIFRKLWGLPLSGLVALTKKLVSNELLFGYAGEVYFYSWARKKLKMATSPFGAVKDVAILSAMVGNAITLLMLALTWPLFQSLNLRIKGDAWLLSIGFIIATSTIILIFSKRLFSLNRRELGFVSVLHFVRTIVSTTLGGMAWAIALPIVPLGWWVMLATVRLLISRLPFLPNKDVVFAGVAVFLVGYDAEIGALMALWASLILLTHLVVGTVLATGDLLAVRTENT